MMDTIPLAENTLVTAHVIGHADFAKRNSLFARFMGMAGGHILEQRRPHPCARECPTALRASTRLKPCWTPRWRWNSTSTSTSRCTARPTPSRPQPDTRRRCLPPALPCPCPAKHRRCRRRRRAASYRRRIQNRICCGSSPRYAPELQDWERDIFLAVREEAFYFYPVHACQIMNEGWASYWHARLLRRPASCRRSSICAAARPLGRGAALRQ
jgi:stage V sporulation protein R